MKKDSIYSMRMSRRVRDALRNAANRERRTVASLLDKIITDYLEKEGFPIRDDFTEERRTAPRKKITLPVNTILKAGPETTTVPSVILDLSRTGVLITYPKGSAVKLTSIGELPHFELQFELPVTGEKLRFDCDARRMADVGNEIQVGATFRNPAREDKEKLEAYLI